jgi:hypothetical protein
MSRQQPHPLITSASIHITPRDDDCHQENAEVEPGEVNIDVNRKSD